VSWLAGLPTEFDTGDAEIAVTAVETDALSRDHLNVAVVAPVGVTVGLGDALPPWCISTR
jgi:hypothetical protein